MFDRIIRFSIRNKPVVAMGVLALIIWGVVALHSLPIDAVPDITNNQVQVLAPSPSLAAEDVERLVTTPMEQALASIPGTLELRSLSRFGLSVITLVFADNVDPYWARSQVQQRLADVAATLPPGTPPPSLAPVTTGLGEIYQYTLHVHPAYTGQYTLTDLRTIQDWTIRRGLLGTDGVADVSSFGGFVRRIAVCVDPQRLTTFGLTSADVVDAVRRNNANAGSSFLERHGQATFIRTEGLVQNPSDLAPIPLVWKGAVAPLRLSDVATIEEDHQIRFGAMAVDGRTEAVGGIVMMLKGANSSDVIAAVKERVEVINTELPEGITIVPYQDRTVLVNKAIDTVSTNLIEGALIVIFVLVLLLGNLRAGLIVASVIPLAMLFAIAMMRLFGVSGNLMSLGAIDFGLIVDGAVIIVENVLHHLGGRSGAEAERSIQSSAISIRRSAAFGEVIILIVYLPILALTGIEGKMFAPMAQTVMFAIVGAFILSTTYVPMMSALLLRRGVRQRRTVADHVMNAIARLYGPVRRAALRHQALALSIAAGVLLAAIVGFLSMGGEFLPQLDEGDFAIETRLATGSSLQSTIDAASQASQLLKEKFPEVRTVVAKVGTSEIPLDPMPMEACDLIVVLKDRSEWTSASSREELAVAMERELSVLAGVSFGFQQPIQMRFNELMTGARQDVVIKIYGDSMDSLAHYAARLGHLVSSIPGACDVAVEPIDGLPQTVIHIDREAAARWGTTVDDVNLAIMATNAGAPAGTFVDGGKRFDIVVRYDSLARRSAAGMASLAVPTMMGVTVPLGQVATLEERTGPNQIQHDRTRRRITVGFNVRGRDVQSIVTDVRQAMATSLQLPQGYSTHIGGQFENLDAARSRLALAVPVALLLIIVLLYATVKSLADTILIFSAIPLAAIGGVAALAIRGMPFSISAGVGFIALFGVAVLNGIVLVASFHGLRTSGAHNLLGVVLRGTSQRLRPVAMTALVASLGFLPMALSHGDGAEVQRPLATVVIGGLISSTMLTLLVLPIMYLRVHGRSGARLLRTPTTASLLVLCAVLLTAAPLQGHVQRSEDSAVAAALQLHPTAIAARAVVRQAEAMEKAAFDPGRTTVMVTSGQINSAAIDNNISIQQTLSLPPVWIAEASLARARTQVAATTERTAMVGIAIMVRQMYRRVVALRLMDSLYGAHDNLVSATLAIARRRLAEGDANAVEVGLLEADAAALRVQRHSHRSERNQAEALLAALTGSSEAVVDTTGWQGPLQEDSSVLAVWDEQRSALTAAANAQVDAERNQWWPLVTVGWFTQTLVGPQTGFGAERWNGPSDRFSGVAVGLHLPLWFPAHAGRLERARAEAQAAQAIAVQKRRMSVDVWHGHRNRLAALRSSIQEIRNILLPTTEAMVMRSRSAWVEGSIGIAEVQQALARHLQARLDGIRASLELTLLSLETSMIGDL